MYINSRIGGDIHQGDLIAVADGNDFTIGVYFGRGRGGTVQYYIPRHVVQSREWWENAQKDKDSKVYHHVNKPWTLSTIWKSFVNTPRDTRVMKLHRESIINEQMIDDLQKSKEILAQFNIPVNF
jgi:hypothetical protein